MDDGLVQRVSNVIEAVYAVLILIVVDNGLVPNKADGAIKMGLS